MAIEQTVYLAQTFLKVKPTDRTELIERAKRESIELAKRYKEIIIKENITEEETRELVIIASRIKSASLTAQLDKYDYTGMDHFWTFSSRKDVFNLFTIPNKKKDVICMSSFNSIGEIFDEFRSLDDIVANSTFVGKKLHSNSNLEAYILYDFNDMLLGISLNKEGNPIGPLLARKNGVKDIAYVDESIPELNDPQIIYNYVKILKNRGN